MSNNDVFKLIDYGIKKGLKRLKVAHVEIEFGEKKTLKRQNLRKPSKEDTIVDEMDRLLIDDPLERERLLEQSMSDT